MYKKIAFLLMACLMATAMVLASCGGTDLREFADKYIVAEDKAWAQGNTSDLEKLEASDVVIHNVPYGADIVGWDAHEKLLLDTRVLFTSHRQEWKYLTGEGNHFAMAYKCYFTTPGDTPETSMEGTNDSLFLFRLNKGRIIEVWINGSVTMAPTSTAQ